MGKQGAQGREGLFPGAERQDNDTRMVLSTTMASPEAEERDVKKKMASHFPATGSKPTGPPVLWG